MYESFFGFKEKPFSLLPDPGFLYPSKKHSMALTMLQYGLMNQAGITVITGEVGSGKTTLIRKLLSEIDEDISTGLISNTHESFGDLLEWVSMAFSLDYKGKDKVALYDTFVNYVINEYANSKRTVLIIDEAQNLSPSVLEELRMLSNINADKDQVLQLILVGQPELRGTLQRQDLRQFAQRVSADYHLSALLLDEAVGYIQHRIKVAGGSENIFEMDACKIIWKYSGGIPRLINTLCDTALVYAYAEQIKVVSLKLASEVIIEKQKGGIFPVLGNNQKEQNISV
ncbi:General secretion pathway protein A [hydrothermal vent metagenome]|uniref:General secretion pathway protein A n=1 Tax=hydrothermal vent metagenome TaxID=652676 RepID=A0A3B1BRQ3_9ZZZZ